MSRIRKKRIKPRAWLVRSMRLHTKPGAHVNRKKERDRRACREILELHRNWEQPWNED
ncbi:hypothetical protein [Desulfomonile tiedjei]|uniref:hypothetical protein n=1 Tax=Desulfomonile tiedjei TaxID=2358 RepID=UPI0002F215A3|nr:hypothetical protein [Desulfomonile tiedjei]